MCNQNSYAREECFDLSIQIPGSGHLAVPPPRPVKPVSKKNKSKNTKESYIIQTFESNGANISEAEDAKCEADASESVVVHLEDGTPIVTSNVSKAIGTEVTATETVELELEHFTTLSIKEGLATDSRCISMATPCEDRVTVMEEGENNVWPEPDSQRIEIDLPDIDEHLSSGEDLSLEVCLQAYTALETLDVEQGNGYNCSWCNKQRTKRIKPTRGNLPDNSSPPHAETLQGTLLCADLASGSTSEHSSSIDDAAFKQSPEAMRQTDNISPETDATALATTVEETSSKVPVLCSATKRIVLLNTPLVLALHLKRLLPGGKFTEHISFPGNGLRYVRYALSQ